MVSRIFFILVLFIGQLLPSDKKSENKFQKDIRTVVKRVVIPLGIGIAVSVLSNKAAFWAVDKDGDGMLGSCFFNFNKELLPLVIFGNFKIIPVIASWKKMISSGTGQKVCHLITVAHGCCAAAICRRGLNRFFPS